MHHPVLPTTTRYSRTYATSSLPFAFAASLLSSAFVSASSSLSLSHFRSFSSPRFGAFAATLFFPVSLLFVRRYCVLFFPSPVRQPLFRLFRTVAVYLLSLPRAPLYISLDCPCPGFPSAYFDRRRHSSFSPLLDALPTLRFRFIHTVAQYATAPLPRLSFVP